MQDICITKIKDPSCFWGFKANEDNESEFKCLQNEIHAYFSDEQMYKAILANPAEGMRCIVRSDTSTWDRARIELVMIAPRSYKARCFLVDKIKSIVVYVNRLYVSPEWIWNIPSRGMKLSLHGIVPAVLTTDYTTDQVNRSTSMKWSTAANEFFQNMVKNSDDSGMVEVLETSDNGMRNVRLFVKSKAMKSLMCVNDILIKRKLAFPKPNVVDDTSMNNINDGHGRDLRSLGGNNVPEESFKEQMQKMCEDIKAELASAAESDTTLSVDSSVYSPDKTIEEADSPVPDLCGADSDDSDFSDIPPLSDVRDSNLSFNAEIIPNNSTSCSTDQIVPSVFRDSPPTAPSGPRVLPNSPSHPADKKHGKALDLLNVQLPRAASNPPSVQRCIRNNDISEFPLPASSRAASQISASSRATSQIPASSRAASQISASSRAASQIPASSRATSQIPASSRAASQIPASLRAASQIPASSRAASQITARDTSPSDKAQSKNEEISELVLKLKSHELDRITSAKLDDIMSMSDDEMPPGRMPSSVKKILMLEKLLHDTEHKDKHLCTHDLNGLAKRKPTVLPFEGRQVKLSPLYNGEEEKVELKPNKKKGEEEVGFFSSAISLSKSAGNSGITLVKGVSPPNPISLFCEAPFPPFIISIMENLRYRGPYCLQAHSWAAILEKRNVVALSPARGGKTLAYVAPIASMLITKAHTHVDKSVLNKAQATYLRNQSPLVVVLCSTWRNVEAVVDYFKTFLNDPNRTAADVHRVVGISGGADAEKANAITLLCGCSVLVCSPHTLTRLYRAKLLSLSRLEQLVFDDFHILVEEFTPQVRQAMKMWSEALNDPDRPPIPSFKPQILCFGIQWTPGVESFVENFMSKPLLYVSDPLEAAVFGQVEHRLEMKKQHALFDYLVAILKSDMDTRTGGIAVFVSEVTRMKELASALKNLGFFTFEAHDNMPDHELMELQQTYEDASTSPVLLICDNVLSVIDVDMIEVAIHYDFPRNGQTLGLRLSLMRSFFTLKKKESDGAVAKPRSYLLFTEKDFSSSMWLSKFLTRISLPTPPLLQKSIKAMVESEEMSKSNHPLCPFLLAYGRCRDVSVCLFRHWISKKADAPNSNRRYPEIPSSGHVRVRITSVKNATYYYARLVKHRSPDNVITSYRDVFQQLTDILHDRYSDRVPKLSRPPVLGELCGLKVFGRFHRVQVVATPANKFRTAKSVCWKTPGGVTKTRVHLVDTGAFHVVNIEELAVLPSEVVEIPFQAVEIRSCGATPIDQDTEWLFSANKLVHQLIYDKEIEGNIMLALNHTLWLNPVLIRSKLPQTGVYVTECNAINELLQSGFAVKLETHLENLLAEVGDVKPCGDRSLANPTDLSAERGPETKKLNGNAGVVANTAMKGGTVIKEPVIKGPVTNGPVKKGPVTNGPVIKGPVTNGLVKKGPVTNGPVEKGPITNGPVKNGPFTNGPAKTEDVINGKNIDRRPNEAVIRRSSSGFHQERQKQSPSHHILPKSVAYSTFERKQPDELVIPEGLPPLSCDLPSCVPPLSTVTSGYDTDKTSDLAGNYRGKVFDRRRVPNRTSSPKKHKKKSPFRRHTPSRRPPNPSSSSSSEDSLESSRRRRSSEETTPTNPSRASRTQTDSFSKSQLLTSDNSKTPVASNSPATPNNGQVRPHPSSYPRLSAEKKPQTVAPSSNKNLTKTTFANTSNDLPPINDVDGAGVIYPYYVRLAHTDNIAVRLKTCESIYIQASQNYAAVSERDLESLNKAIRLTRNDRERTLLFYTLMSLASCNVPVQDYVNLPELFVSYCIKQQPNQLDLHKSLVTLSLFVLDHLIEKHKDQLPALVDAYVTYLDHVTCRVQSGEEASFLLKNILTVLETIATDDKQSFARGDENRLIGILARFRGEEGTGEIRKRLFQIIISDEKVAELPAQESRSSPSTCSSSKKSKVAKAKPKKVYDRLDYDRFNGIDTTDSEMSSSSRPYTPIPVRFDSETDTVYTETDTDSDFLPGM